MNIEEAKRELVHTVKAYTARDVEGNYRISRAHQRPVLLIGPPGIGKTAAVGEAARECGVGLVSCTFTYCSCQSERISAMYKDIENTGCREGILFLDGVQSVSEVLMPAVAQILQEKGTEGRRIPQGWTVVAAGIPGESGGLAGLWDVAVLDRVKQIRVDADYEVWKRYAAAREIHGAIRSYLYGRPEDFCRFGQIQEEMEIVTARGWEDLSEILKEYENMGAEVTENLVGQYLQCREVSRDFAVYYSSYKKYEQTYEEEIERLIEGEQVRGNLDARTQEEQLAAASFLISRLLERTGEWVEQSREQSRLEEVLELLKQQARDGDRILFQPIIDEFFQKRSRELEAGEEAQLIREEDARLERAVDRQLKRIFSDMKEEGIRSWQKASEMLERKQEARRSVLETQAGLRREEIGRVLEWISGKYGTGIAFQAAMETVSSHEGCRKIMEEKGGPEMFLRGGKHD